MLLEATNMSITEYQAKNMSLVAWHLGSKQEVRAKYSTNWVQGKHLWSRAKVQSWKYCCRFARCLACQAWSRVSSSHSMMWLRAPCDTIPCIQSWRYPLDGLRRSNPAKQALAKRPLGWHEYPQACCHLFIIDLVSVFFLSANLFQESSISWSVHILSWLNKMYLELIFKSSSLLHCFHWQIASWRCFCTVGMFDYHCLVCLAMFVLLSLHPSNGRLGTKRVLKFLSWFLKKMPFKGDPCSSVNYSFQ